MRIGLLSRTEEMPRLFAILRSVAARRRFWLAVAAGAVVLSIASPFVWAAYHAYAAQTALARYHSDEAQTHFRACLSVWPWSRSLHLHLLAARAARREGDFAEADRLLHQCQDDPKSRSQEAVLEWAMLRAAMGDLDKAEQLRNAARRDPQLIPLVCEALAEGYLTMSRLLEGLSSTDDWLRREPNNPQAWFVRGKIDRQAGFVQDAANDYQHVLDVDPERTEARWWLAFAQLDIGRYEQAYQNLLIVQRQRPNDAELRVHKAMCLRWLDQRPEACRLLDEVLVEQPDHGLALRTRGEIALDGGRFDEAEPFLRRAAQALPYDQKAQNALWECFRQQGKTEEAEAQRERRDVLYERRTRQTTIQTRLLPQKPDDLALQCELGKLDLQLGAPQVGEAWLLNVLRLDPNYLPALEALAQHYQERGDRQRAEEYRRRARLVPKK
jgi:predicted Zn-dependent protease